MTICNFHLFTKNEITKLTGPTSYYPFYLTFASSYFYLVGFIEIYCLK